MTLHMNSTAKRRNSPPRPEQHGTEMVAIFEYTFTTGFTTATDVIEFGLLPAGARVTGATLIGAGLGANTADVGTLDGEPGANDDTRALTTDLLFDDESVNDTEGDATTATCLAIPKSDKHRGIGAHISADIAAGAAKKLTLVLRYIYE